MGGGGSWWLRGEKVVFLPSFSGPLSPRFIRVTSGQLLRGRILYLTYHKRKTPKNRMLGRQIVRRFLRTGKDKNKDLRREHRS